MPKQVFIKLLYGEAVSHTLRSHQREQLRAEQKTFKCLSKTIKQSSHHNTEKWDHIQGHHDKM